MDTNDSSLRLWRVFTTHKDQPLLMIRACEATIGDCGTLKFFQEDGLWVLALARGEWRSVSLVEYEAQNGEKEKR